MELGCWGERKEDGSSGVLKGRRGRIWDGTGGLSQRDEMLQLLRSRRELGMDAEARRRRWRGDSISSN